jgi:hypothetical protein
MQSSLFSLLPPELQEYIFYFCSHSLPIIRRVNHTWYQLAERPYRDYIQREPISLTELRSYLTSTSPDYFGVLVVTNNVPVIHYYTRRPSGHFEVERIDFSLYINGGMPGLIDVDGQSVEEIITFLSSSTYWLDTSTTVNILNRRPQQDPVTHASCYAKIIPTLPPHLVQAYTYTNNPMMF